MNTIIFHDLEELSKGSRSGNKGMVKKSFKVYINITNNDNKKNYSGTHCLTFSNDFFLDFPTFTKVNLAENSLTGEKFIVLSEKRGVALDLDKKRFSYKTQRNTVVKFFASFLKLDCSKKINEVFSCVGENLSKDTESLVFRIKTIN